MTQIPTWVSVLVWHPPADREVASQGRAWPSFWPEPGAAVGCSQSSSCSLSPNTRSRPKLEQILLLWGSVT